MGYMTDGLTFNVLRDANINRLPTFKNAKGLPAHSEPDGSDWSPAQWLQAVMGETGEYANIRKKFERGDIDESEFKALASQELADVVTYLDILSFRLGINLGQAVVEKFNLISKRVGSPVFMNNTGTDWYYKNELEKLSIRFEYETHDQYQEALEKAEDKFHELLGAGYSHVRIIDSHHWASKGVWVEAGDVFQKISNMDTVKKAVPDDLPF